MGVGLDHLEGSLQGFLSVSEITKGASIYYRHRGSGCVIFLPEDYGSRGLRSAYRQFCNKKNK